MQWMMVCTQVDGSVWATLLALIWLYGCKIEQQVEWQFVAMKAASWIGSQKGEISIPDIDSVSVHREMLSRYLQFFDTHWWCVCVCVSVGDLSQCVCVGNVLLGCQVTKETLGIWRCQCFYILIRQKTKNFWCFINHFCQGFIKIVFFICLNPHHIIIQNL